MLEYIDDFIDVKKKPKYKYIEIPKEGYLIQKGEFFLASSKEKVGSERYVPIIHAKSGIARLGLFVHVTADLIDIGSLGKVTFQLYATQNIKIYTGQKIGQVSFWKTKGEIQLYEGKYNGAEKPLPSQIYKDFII